MPTALLLINTKASSSGSIGWAQPEQDGCRATQFRESSSPISVIGADS